MVIETMAGNGFRPRLKRNFEIGSSLYNYEEIASFRDEVIRLGKKISFLVSPYFLSRETKGVRAWEYGKLLTTLKTRGFEFQHKKILDVGTGGSLLPDYLASLGAKVTSVDIDKALEKREENSKVKFVKGEYD